ncbi:MAG: citrate (Si)-synthase, partial [Deltaproteobacteria bacterium]|nr:citrate (Si)-synthase [Deltaproteobacteria bacterium]
MATLKEKLATKIEEWRPRTTKLLRQYGDVKIGEVTVAQAIGGMRGIKGLVTDISYLDPNEGIRFRGYTIPETLEKLPKVPGSEMPYVEGLFFLLLTGDIPTETEVNKLCESFKKRSSVPEYVFDILKAMPIDTHPMTMLSTAIVAMQRESKFVTQYHQGLNKQDFWKPTYEDSMSLLAKMPQIAAFIYRLKYKSGDIIEPNPDLDMGGNFAHMMGIEQPYDDVSRLYFILHSDHES